ncbi:MAG: ASPIC/UnbV domain-containing protein [Planctomycetota bacterium]
MVADAKAVETGGRTSLTNANIQRDFRGSWSGYERDCLFQNPDGLAPRFVNCGYLYGLDFDDDGRSACPVDIDGDGDLDMVCLSLQGLRLMENTSPKRHFARIRLSAGPSHVLPLNALVRVTAGGVTQQDTLRITDGFLSQVPADLHFGLGSADKIDAVEITWPGSGTPARFSALPANRLLEFVPGEAAPRVSELRAWPAETRPRLAPEFSFAIAAKGLDGSEGPLAEKGKPAVVNFWSPTCAPCKEELPLLAAAADRLAGQVRFAGVSTEIADVASVTQAAAAFKLNYPQFLANDALVRSFFGAGGAVITPSTFVFDAGGRLRRVFQRTIAAGELEALLSTLRDEGLSAYDLERRGMRFMDVENYEQAAAFLKQASDLRGDDAMLLYNLGVALQRLGRKGESHAAFLRSFELDPGYAPVHHNLAEALRLDSRFEEAAVHYLEAIRIRGDEYETCWGLGDCWSRLGRSQEALLAFDRAIAMDSRQTRALKSKALELSKLGKPGEAAAILRKVLSLAPGDKEAAQWLEQLR